MLEEKVSEIEESIDKEDRRVVMLKDVTARLKCVILVNIIFVTSRWKNGEVEATLTKISLEVVIRCFPPNFFRSVKDTFWQS